MRVTTFFFFSERTFGNGWLKTFDQMNKEEPDGANNNPAAQAVPKMEVPETSNSSDIKDEDGVWSADIEQVLVNFYRKPFLDFQFQTFSRKSVEIESAIELFLGFQRIIGDLSTVWSPKNYFIRRRQDVRAKRNDC